MEGIKRVLVALDLTEMDETLIGYIARLSNQIELEQVYFFNVMKSMEIPDKILEKYPNLVAPMDEATKKGIQYTIDEEAGNQLKANYEIKVTDGNPTDKILKWAKVKEVDLIVVGRKSSLQGDGIVSGKIVRLAPCSVLLVPEALPDTLAKVVVPIDFSAASKTAFEFSIYLAKRIQNLQVICLNIYEVPTGYHTSGKSFEEFAEVMKNNAEESFNEFIEGYNLKGLNVVPRYELNENTRVSKKIYRFAMKENASAIIVGSKGRTQAAALLIGSVAERLLKLNSHLPQYVIKEHRKNMDLMDALSEI